MALRYIEIIASEQQEDALTKLLGEHQAEGVYSISLGKEIVLVRAVIRSEKVEEITGQINPKEDGAIQRVTIGNVEATIPVIELPEAEQEAPAKDEEPALIKVGKFIRISREELRDDIEEATAFNVNYLLMVIFSTVVAGVGIIKGSIAIVIGAMVIAPFLGPNMGLAFGATIGDLALVRRSLATAAMGTVVALGISIIWGFLDAGVASIEHPATIQYRDIALALACGFAGALSMLTVQAGALVGVMVAVALLPPLMRAGLFLGGQFWLPALNDFLVFLTNLICVNIAGIVTFILAGIQPASWWEKETAMHHRRIAIIIWLSILALLIGTIYLINRVGEEGDLFGI